MEIVLYTLIYDGNITLFIQRKNPVHKISCGTKYKIYHLHLDGPRWRLQGLTAQRKDFSQ